MLWTEGCISTDRDSLSEIFSASVFSNFSEFDNEQIKTPLTCRLDFQRLDLDLSVYL